MAAKTCSKRVFSGARHDMSGHTCGHAAINGTDFCHLHGGKEESTEDPRRGQLAEPTVSSSQKTIYQATLTWEEGAGPVVKIPFRKGFGFLTRVAAQQTTDSQGPAIRAYGRTRKSNGTVGVQQWSSDFQAERVIPEETLTQLLALLDQECGR